MIMKLFALKATVKGAVNTALDVAANIVVAADRSSAVQRVLGFLRGRAGSNDTSVEQELEGYELVEVGEYNTETCQITPCEPVVVCTEAELKEALKG